MSRETPILSLLWVRPILLCMVRNLSFLIFSVLTSPPLPFLGCEVPNGEFDSVEALLDVARSDLFPHTPNTRLPSTTLEVAEASIYTRVYYWFFSDFSVVFPSGDVCVSQRIFIFLLNV